VYPINRDKDAFTATTILLEIYLRYKELGMDFLDVLDTVYTEYGFNYAVTVSYEFSGMD
jgi:hypothetical protein